MRLQPGEIVLDPRGVDHEEKFLVFDSVQDEVVDDPRLVIQQKRVMAGADFEFGDVIGQHGVEPFAGPRTARDQLAHV